MTNEIETNLPFSPDESQTEFFEEATTAPLSEALQKELFEIPVRFYPDIKHPAMLDLNPTMLASTEPPKLETSVRHPATFPDSETTERHPLTSLKRSPGSSVLQLRKETAKLLHKASTAIDEAKKTFSNSPHVSPSLGPSDHAKANELIAQLCALFTKASADISKEEEDMFDATFVLPPSPLLLPSQLSSPTTSHHRRCSIDVNDRGILHLDMGSPPIGRRVK